MITCKNIFKSYDKLQVVKGVSLEISKGDLVCIVGPSGAGKSTLLHIIGTLDKADSGFVSINGQDPAFIARKSQSQAEKRAMELLDFLGLKDRMYHKPNELSGGEQQRVSVARALMNNPLVILADEPTGNLDTERSEELHQLFFDLKKEFNQTFVIVTHNELLANRADKKFSMKDGLIIKKIIVEK